MKPRLFRIFGCLLLLLAALGAFVWFYWLAPYRHWTSDLWMHDHASDVHWGELQKLFPRQMIWDCGWPGYLHTAGDFLGWWGNEETASWLIAEMKTGREFWSCSGHLHAALPLITNQGDRRGTNKWEVEAWISWWSTNSQKSQLEWIRDGFKERGFEFRQPLTTNDVLILLKLAFPAKFKSLTGTTNRVGEGLQFNACRWLRDAGFRTDDFDLKQLDALTAEEREGYVRALIGYANWVEWTADFPGRLPIRGPEKHEWSREGIAEREGWINRRPYCWLPHLVVVALAGFGILLLRRAGKPAKPYSTNGIH